MPASILDKPFFRDEAEAYAKLEGILWPHGSVCPHCGTIGQAGRLQGKSVRPGLWKCYACRKQFRVTVGTVFESSHVPLHQWLQAVYLMMSSKKGFSSHQMSRTMGVTIKTAWFMTHRIREALKPTVTGPLGGAGRTVEADETYIGRKSTSKAFKPPAKKQAVMALVERGGKVRTFHVPSVTSANLRPIIARHAHPDSRFVTDEAPIYKYFPWKFSKSGKRKPQAKRIRPGRYPHEYCGGIFLNTQAGRIWHLSTHLGGAPTPLPCRVRLSLFLPDQDWIR